MHKISLEDLQTVSLDFLAKQMVEGFITGMHKSPYHGFSVEFAEHKIYNPGESTRHIDWKLYAKTDRFYTKSYEEETNLRCHLVIDNSSSMHYPEESQAKIKFSALTAAALCYLMQKQRDAFGLISFSDRIELQTEVKSTRLHMQKCFSELENLLNSPSKLRPTKASESLHLIAQKIHKRSLVILFTDMFTGDEDEEELFKALLHLKHQKHEIILFHVTDPLTEREFQFDDRPYEFVDIESGEKMKLRPDDVKEKYVNLMRAFYQRMKLKCAQYRIDFVEANAQNSFYEVLNAYLIKRSKLK
ncbi:MAG: DUF58 domain-containing protein [Cyclobacteriaceae bacterium]|nr:DUF58 domain-containing protein [Cyclobacteriaceae bacterium]MCH8516978.1 DUF58 domain-containing protein [Cyclobacteriaceae bacterium]